jgi:hypothetical protein
MGVRCAMALMDQGMAGTADDFLDENRRSRESAPFRLNMTCLVFFFVTLA